MLGDFTYCNPTKLHFGQNALDALKEELKKYGQKVLLAYGGGSIKKNGIYDKVMKVLKECGKTVIEDGGVMPNPTLEKLCEGIRLARENDVDFILAVGGGSTCDLSCKIIPVGCVVTMVGTGSEMNGGSVITNHAQKLKIGHVFGENVFPKFAILNPEFTFSVPKYQMVSGIFDIMSHIMEQYFSGSDDNTSDYIAEGLMRSLINSSLKAVHNPEDYEARSNIMWTATWALNTLIAQGKTTDWEVHMIGQAVSAHTDATHGMTLAAVSPAYYRLIMPYAVDKFKRFALNVWQVIDKGKSDIQIAEEGIEAMEEWMRKLNLVMNIKDLGVNENMLDAVADSTLIMQGGYKVIDKGDVIAVLKASL